MELGAQPLDEIMMRLGLTSYETLCSGWGED
jgi:hypothetical protein